MAIPPDPIPANPTITGAATRIGTALIAVLPPAFLVLVGLNVAFLGIVMYFLNFQIDQRTHLVEKIIDHCYELESHPHER